MQLVRSQAVQLASKARSMGGSGLSFDIRQGCDLLDLATQVEVNAVLDEVPPELLVCCPPCTYWGVGFSQPHSQVAGGAGQTDTAS